MMMPRKLSSSSEEPLNLKPQIAVVRTPKEAALFLKLRTSWLAS
jgi:hypothetical protein